jgi:hypothetical protein
MKEITCSMRCVALLPKTANGLADPGDCNGLADPEDEEPT